MPSPTRPTRRRRRQSNYQVLEDRRLLAVISSFDQDTGTLSIEMTETGDSVLLDRSSVRMLINGSDDIDTNLAGEQHVAYTDVRHIQVFNSSSAATDQSFTVRGNFSNLARTNLQSVEISGINEVTFNGTVEINGDLRVSMNDNDSGGAIHDYFVGWLVVHGDTYLEAGDNEIEIDNYASSFAGDVSVSSQQNIVLTTSNSFRFASVAANADFTAIAYETIDNIEGANIEIAGVTTLNSDQVVLGNQSGDSIRLGELRSTTRTLTEIHADDSTTLGIISTPSLLIESTDTIFDIESSVVDVSGQLTLRSQNAIQVGENLSDFIRANTVTLDSSSSVNFQADSGIQLVGNNRASSLNLVSEFEIINSDNTALNVAGLASFQSGSNIILGDKSADQINTGSVQFNAAGDFHYTEDSSVQFTEDNSSRRFYLTSDGNVTDTVNSEINVERIAMFWADNVALGDTFFDEFNAGSIAFQVDQHFQISEDGSMNIVGFNFANSLAIQSNGTLSNVYRSTTGRGTQIAVTTTAQLSAANSIEIGVQADDEIRFGSLTVNSPNGLAEIQQDNDILLTGQTSVRDIQLQSTGSITDSTTSSFFATGNASFTGSDIVIGDQITDRYDALSTNVQATGSVEIIENSGLNLYGINRAESLTIRANGLITDSFDADTQIIGHVDLQGTLINLGTDLSDFLTFGSISYNSVQNTNISANSDIVMSGNSLVGNQLILASTGDILDSPDADTRVQNRAVLTGVDVIIGELASDCFTIMSGGADDVFVVASGSSDIQLGC
ncbi:MAG: hypothetical protein AAF623_00055 [Planctomycetota bacterium]